jgi:hypothetical protein
LEDIANGAEEVGAERIPLARLEEEKPVGPALVVSLQEVGYGTDDCPVEVLALPDTLEGNAELKGPTVGEADDT